MNVFDYLFFQIYYLFDEGYLTYGLSKLEYRAAGIISVVLYLNFITGLNWIGFNVFNFQSALLPVIVVIIFVAVSIGYFTAKARLEKIRKRYEHTSSRERTKGIISLLLYITISLLLFTISF